jgi:hypothetical protein
MMAIRFRPQERFESFQAARCMRRKTRVVAAPATRRCALRLPVQAKYQSHGLAHARTNARRVGCCECGKRTYNCQFSKTAAPAPNREHCPPDHPAIKNCGLHRHNNRSRQPHARLPSQPGVRAAADQ